VTAPSAFQDGVLAWAGNRSAGRTRIQVEYLGYESAGTPAEFAPAHPNFGWSCNDCGLQGRRSYPTRGAAAAAAERFHPTCQGGSHATS
jgi:hypothetical protein